MRKQVNNTEEEEKDQEFYTELHAEEEGPELHAATRDTTRHAGHARHAEHARLLESVGRRGSGVARL